MGDRIHSALTGIATLRDWLGEDGEPVATEVAESRSSVCRHGGPDGKPCPFNYAGDWWDMVSAEVAISVLNQRAEKARLQIKLHDEVNLGTCKVCLCHLPVKCLVPIEHIIKHTTDEVWNELPPHCWIKAEGSAIRQTLKRS